MKKKTIESTFVMRSEKIKELKSAGFNLDEIIILKEELGKVKENDAAQ